MSVPSVRELLRPPIDMTALSRRLDAMTHIERLAAVRSLRSAEQAALFDAAKGFRPVDLRMFVPEEFGLRSPVIHHGKNSLPLFALFQKRFCRLQSSDGAPADELVGYNHQLFSWFTGPGYFVAYMIADGEALIDYTRLPTETIPSWPRIIPNHKRLSRWIYNGTQDTMRGVSEHVTIGRASRAGKPMPNWFVLCREDPEHAALPIPAVAGA